MIGAGRGGLGKWLELRNRHGNKLPDEGYWKYCHNSKQVESFFGFLPILENHQRSYIQKLLI
jgi:hypothetical protein